MKSPRNAIGSQRPRLVNLPEFDRSLGPQAVKFAAKIGITLDDWQCWLLGQLLGRRADGRWSAPDAGICIGRQNGKNEVLVVRELFGLLVLGEREIFHTAHLQKAADTQFRRVWGVFKETPALKDRMARKNSSYGMQEIELHGGQRIMFTTRQGSKTGRSSSLSLVVHDECMYISDAAIGGIMPALSAQSMHGNLQTIYAGSAPDAEERDHDGLPFARLRRDALGGADDVLWAEWSVDCEDRDTVPDEWLTDRTKLEEANPALGIRISADWCASEARRLSRRDYLRERLGITLWPDPSEDAERVIPVETWDAAACRDGEQRIIGPKTFALDANVDNTWATIAAAGIRPDDSIHTAIVAHQRTARWMVARCEELQAEHPRCQFVLDVRGPLHHLRDELVEKLRDVVEADTTDYAEACAGFVEGVKNGMIRYPFPQPELSEAVAAARQQSLGDRWKWARRASDAADISPLVAASLAVWAAARAPKPFDGPLMEWV
jgi:hypothetical protein